MDDEAEFIHPEDRSTVKERSTPPCDRSVRPMVSTFMPPDGKISHVEDRGSTFGPVDPNRMAQVARGVIINIADRRKAEEGLARATAQLAAFFDNAPFGLAIWDEDLRFVRINAHLSEINGLPPEAHIRRRPTESSAHRGDRPDRTRMRTIVETGTPWADVEVIGETPAQPGIARSWSEHFYPIRVGPRAVGIAALVEESTERKRVDMALKETRPACARS